jgi:hypothetical protein
VINMISKNEHFDLVIVMFGEPHHEWQRNITADDYLNRYHMENCKPKPVIAVVPDRSLGINHYDAWNWKIIYELRSKILASGIPYYPSIRRAAVVARKAADYWRYRNLVA